MRTGGPAHLPLLTPGRPSLVPEAPVCTHQPALPQPWSAPLESVDVRQIYDKFPEKKGGLRELYDRGPPHAFFLVKFWVSSTTKNKRAHKSRGLPAQATGSKGDSLRTCPGQPELYQFSWLPVSAPLAARNRKEFCPQGGMDGTSAGVGTSILRRLH